MSEEEKVLSQDKPEDRFRQIDFIMESRQRDERNPTPGYVSDNTDEFESGVLEKVIWRSIACVYGLLEYSHAHRSFNEYSEGLGKSLALLTKTLVSGGFLEPDDNAFGSILERKLNALRGISLEQLTIAAWAYSGMALGLTRAHDTLIAGSIVSARLPLYDFCMSVLFNKTETSNDDLNAIYTEKKDEIAGLDQKLDDAS